MIQTYQEAAKKAGILLMPGAGFDVVPTDCIAMGLKNKMPEAVSLELAFATLGVQFLMALLSPWQEK
jgi:short subunit dehydrogenase-like uncharacterized protein